MADTLYGRYTLLISQPAIVIKPSLPIHNKSVASLSHDANNVMSCQYAFLPTANGCFSLSDKVDLAQIGPDSLLAAADGGDSEVLTDYWSSAAPL